MPTYDYICTTCGATFEVFQAMKEQPLATCPSSVCTGGAPGQGIVERRISGGGGVLYKGGGFYLTDYVKKSGSGGESE